MFFSYQKKIWKGLLFGIWASHSRISSDNRCGFTAENFLVGLSKLNPTCPQNPVGDIIFDVFINFFIFGLSGKTFRIFGCLFSAGLTNCLLRLQKRFMRERDFFGSKIFFPSFSDFELMILRLSTKKTGRVIKTAFYVCRGTIWQKTVFERKQILHFLIFSSKFSDLHLKNLAGLSNLPSASPKEQAGGIKYGEKKIIQTSFRLCGRRFQTFTQKFLKRAVKNAFYICRAGFPGNKFFRNIKFYRFSPISSRTFRTLSDKFLAGFSFM